MESSGKHFVLVHGINHGAWCWYKLVPLLKSGGHRVTALDLAANGVNPRRLDEVTSFFEYVQPLTDFMASLPEGEKVILVGHSFGGFVISLAMERFPEKISIAVFLTALMPSYKDPPASLHKEHSDRALSNPFSDSLVAFDSDNRLVSLLFGPEHIATTLYNHSPTEDVELAKMLVRPNSLFSDDLSKPLLTENKYGSVSRVFIEVEDDLAIRVDFQHYMIENFPPKEVKSVVGADHMAMISKPQELYLTMMEIADTYI